MRKIRFRPPFEPTLVGIDSEVGSHYQDLNLELDFEVGSHYQDLDSTNFVSYGGSIIIS